MLREAQKISRPLPLISGEVPRFHGGSLWHSTPESSICEKNSLQCKRRATLHGVSPPGYRPDWGPPGYRTVWGITQERTRNLGVISQERTRNQRPEDTLRKGPGTRGYPSVNEHITSVLLRTRARVHKNIFSRIFIHQIFKGKFLFYCIFFTNCHDLFIFDFFFKFRHLVD